MGGHRCHDRSHVEETSEVIMREEIQAKVPDLKDRLTSVRSYL
jgi:hypothetical protein